MFKTKTNIFHFFFKNFKKMLTKFYLFAFSLFKVVDKKIFILNENIVILTKNINLFNYKKKINKIKIYYYFF